MLSKHEGFEAMPLYPGYTGQGLVMSMLNPVLTYLAADFFDDKHNVVLGGSWATHPRIAGRKSL